MPSHLPGQIKRVCIVGGGSAGWMAAALLSKMLSPLIEITLIESAEVGTIGVGEATIPAIKTFNKLLALDEVEFVRKTQGTFKMGIEFCDWGHVGNRYIHGFGKIGQDWGWLRLHQYWCAARAVASASGQSLPEDIGRYSINVMAARANRFMPARPEAGASPLADIAYAYHFDAGLYARYLRELSEARGVSRVEGHITAVNLRAEDGFIESVTLRSGETLAADLFIDCSGQRSLLLGEALKVPFIGWDRWLFCDRALAVPCERVTPLTPYTRSTAHAAGWQWRIPLQHRTGNGHVFSSAFMDEDEATRILMAGLDGAPQADPRLIRFAIGKRARLWEKNCVAIGLSGGFLEPLESTSLHLIQSGLIRLINLFPDMAFRDADIALYNRQSDHEYEGVRDFIIAHYKLSSRADTPFWQQCQAMTIPDSLNEKLSVFGACGRVYQDGEELFGAESWIMVLLGQGLIPQAPDPAVALKSQAEILAFLGNIETTIDKCVARMPDHADFIARTCAAPKQ